MFPKNLIIDCDDTLWENNRFFLDAHEKFVSLMEAQGYSRERADALLLRLEMENVSRYGYGARSQAMSMADVYGLLEPEPKPEVLEKIRNIGDDVFHHPVCLLPGVEETVPKLAGRYTMVMYTKGNPEEQIGKIEKSPLREYFHHVRVVPEKDRRAFRGVLDELGLLPDETWMIGDSPRSDILPAVENGVRSVFIPFSMTWQHEHTALPSSEHIITVQHFGNLEALLL